MSTKISAKWILDSAIEVAERDGYLNMTRAAIAEQAGVSDGKVSNAYGNMDKLRRAIMRKAIRTNVYKIIIEGVVSNDPIAKKLSSKVKLDAFKAVM